MRQGQTPFMGFVSYLSASGGLYIKLFDYLRIVPLEAGFSLLFLIAFSLFLLFIDN